MNREDIERAVTRLGGLDYFKKDITDFAIEQVNRGIEEAAVVMLEDGRDWSGYIRDKILELKIK